MKLIDKKTGKPYWTFRGKRYETEKSLVHAVKRFNGWLPNQKEGKA